jgi:glycosyltransferase involved in cell wall biosynthesis
MAWLPNVDAAEYLCHEVLPLLDKTGGVRPELVLAGRRPAPKVLALASPRVRVTGEVQDMAQTLRGDTVVVVPLRSGSGMRVKILEAMAWGLPVVSTTLGCAGIDHAGTIVEANGAQVLAEELGRLLHDEKRRRRLGAAARERVALRYGHLGAGQSFIEAMKEAWL